jgi:acetolactate synthase-1/2/3 large subunit
VRVYEAIVKALESVGVDAAFGGAGENAAGAMIALKHFAKIRPSAARFRSPPLSTAVNSCGYCQTR